MNYKRRTNQLLKSLEEKGYHPKDVNFLDGYFLFEHGKNMVVNFHIKECKGWLFGIWWNLEGEEELDFFAQYERTIDKFKPSASTIKAENVSVPKNKKEWNSFNYDVLPILNFIKNNKYQAYYCDVGFIYDPWRLPSKREAFFSYYKDSFKRKNRDCLNNKLNKGWLKIADEICKEFLIDYKIKEESGWPKYRVVCKNIKGKEGIETEPLERGFYTLDGYSPDLPKKLRLKAKKFDEKLKKVIDKKGYRFDATFLEDLEVFVKAK